MKTYTCNKQVRAKPMTRQAYNDLRGWTLPADENGSDAGYLVEYLDGGKANHPDFPGYISWSPADVFTRGYQSDDGPMSFSQALDALNAGGRAARTGWNGRGMFVYLVPAASYPARPWRTSARAP